MIAVFPSDLLYMSHTVTKSSSCVGLLQGCDAFVLLDGPNTERKSVLNGGLHGYDAVDAAKRATEKACPGIVSAPDVLQFAARDSVILASYPPDLWM